MTATTVPSSLGSAQRWGPLWGHRARDWAEAEAHQEPAYRAVLDRLALRPSARLLDVGCGAGTFLALAAARGVRVAGVDASPALVELARRRVPGADVRVGDLQFLPDAEATFDAVTGLTSFFFAQDMVAALREAGRVAKPGAPVVVEVFGAPERCDLEAVKAIIRPYLPAPPPGAPAAPQLWRPGALEALAAAAGLQVVDAYCVAYDTDYPDAATLGRLMLSPAGLAKLVGPAREDAVRREIVDALAPQRRPDGSYRLHTEMRHVVITHA